MDELLESKEGCEETLKWAWGKGGGSKGDSEEQGGAEDAPSDACFLAPIHHRPLGSALAFFCWVVRGVLPVERFFSNQALLAASHIDGADMVEDANLSAMKRGL
ncbi:hypothetical protein [Stigmatella aurantiaca]|uniref:hypothetical protein n=1 Tax=Stigmatella aurantiaca TaxID=41 RepID=UPI001E42F8F3|nr:hypothetical protein [Stigmatella aurantiaca]